MTILNGSRSSSSWGEHIWESITMANTEQGTNQPLAPTKQASKSETRAPELDCNTNALQHQLATWICPTCRLHYSRQAAASAQWHCEECKSSLVDASGQKAA